MSINMRPVDHLRRAEDPPVHRQYHVAVAHRREAHDREVEGFLERRESPLDPVGPSPQRHLDDVKEEDLDEDHGEVEKGQVDRCLSRLSGLRVRNQVQDPTEHDHGSLRVDENAQGEEQCGVQKLACHGSTSAMISSNRNVRT
jgi:hypothetical protein